MHAVQRNQYAITPKTVVTGGGGGGDDGLQS